ncbi:alpha/beta hydrolase [Erythrobacter sp. SG61-1L]|uniref:alpha/beta hydrolase n=1 Tax=Erythrobacter sp. SG61-1L TaxID=1603897 RepID=UPI0006C91CBA|nr:alpha/beta hydrolase [Erythrobacter sp. SG61-1L]
MRLGPRKIGCVLPAALLAVIALLLLGGFYLWARQTQSVATLDRIDGWFTHGRHRLRASLGPDPTQQLYIYPNRGAEPLPVLVFVHGGSWNSGDPADYGFIARNFAPQGYVVVLAGYRLGPKGRFPAMLEDTAAAVAWAHRNAARYGGDPDRILLMGHSAGAYNAAMVALDPQWLGRQGMTSDMIAGVVGLAGPYDFYPFTTDAARQAFGHWPRPAETQPVNFALAKAPPMLLLTGSDDTSVRPRNSEKLASALTAAGAPTRPIVLDGIGHAGILIRLAKPFDLSGETKRRVLAFLAERAESAKASAPVQPPER